MTFSIYQALSESQARFKKLQAQFEEAKLNPKYLITLMPDTQLVYGAKPIGLQRLAAAGVPIPKLPQGFGLASDITELDTTFVTAEEAAIKLRDDILPTFQVKSIPAIIKLHLWVEMRMKEQQSLVEIVSEHVAKYTAIMSGVDTTTKH